MVCLTYYTVIALLIVYVSTTPTATNTENFSRQERSALKRRMNREKRQFGWDSAYPTTYVYQTPYVGYYGSWGYPMMGVY
ncbi:unnamed protein product [Cylicostephanus goldi]|uniref:Uncharacterized protein n=1 Tax=Cylicostephanus goldi TaxID=71465 RepID=A0A3P6TXG5_CYLGO|nr:unnamed protein product [Cylicostephanus goldi]